MAVNINVEEILNCVELRGEWDCLHCLFIVDRLRILVYVSESLIFATEKVVILKHKRLQDSILTKENCFDEFSLKLQRQALWVKGKKMLKSYLPSLVINFKVR